MAEYETIVVDANEGILTITLNRPERLNAMNWQLLQEAADVIEQAGRDDSVKVIVITGAGRGFCSGWDLTPPGPNDEPEPTPGRRLKLTPFKGFGRLSLAIRNCPKLVIAAVNGVAVGAGFAISLACDIRIASENARFSAIFVRRGLFPDTGITYYLPRLIGAGRALELLTTGDIIDAAQADKLGIVNRVVPLDQLMPATMELAAKIAKGPSMAIELAKQAVYHGQLADLETQIGFEGWAAGVCRNSADVQEGRTAFLEKREPVFRGE